MIVQAVNAGRAIRQGELAATRPVAADDRQLVAQEIAVVLGHVPGHPADPSTVGRHGQRLRTVREVVLGGEADQLHVDHVLVSAQVAAPGQCRALAGHQPDEGSAPEVVVDARFPPSGVGNLVVLAGDDICCMGLVGDVVDLAVVGPVEVVEEGHVAVDHVRRRGAATTCCHWRPPRPSRCRRRRCGGWSTGRPRTTRRRWGRPRHRRTGPALMMRSSLPVNTCSPSGASNGDLEPIGDRPDRSGSRRTGGRRRGCRSRRFRQRHRGVGGSDGCGSVGGGNGAGDAGLRRRGRR